MLYIHIYIHIYTHTHIYIVILLNPKQNKILSFTTTWMVLKNIMLSEVSQKKTNIKTMCYQFYMGLKRKKTNVKYKADTD